MIAISQTSVIYHLDNCILPLFTIIYNPNYNQNFVEAIKNEYLRFCFLLRIHSNWSVMTVVRLFVYTGN